MRAAREATEHLLSRGRRRVAVIGGAVRGRQGTDRPRTDGHRDAPEDAALREHVAGHRIVVRECTGG